jgi:phosphoribosyl-ATP pyrophosphohydrolase
MAKKKKAKKKALKKNARRTAVGHEHVLDRLYVVIDGRKGADPDTSYTARLFSRGRQQIAKKLGEEAVEALIEGIRGDKTKLVGESADSALSPADLVGVDQRQAQGGVERARPARGPVGSCREGVAQAQIAAPMPALRSQQRLRAHPARRVAVQEGL